MKSTNVTKCMDDLRKLQGLPPHHGWSNTSRGDSYFASSIRNSYTQDTLDEAHKVVNKESR